MNSLISLLFPSKHYLSHIKLRPLYSYYLYSRYITFISRRTERDGFYLCRTIPHKTARRPVLRGPFQEYSQRVHDLGRHDLRGVGELCSRGGRGFEYQVMISDE